MKRSLYEGRDNLYPLEYPELMAYVDAINNCFWVHTKWSFQGDINDFHHILGDHERTVAKRSLLAISQIEVKVKTAWGKLYSMFPKPELNAVGATFSESEVRHERAYAELLVKLKLEEQFRELEDVPVIKDRIEYLKKYISGMGSEDKEGHFLSIILFSLFIENVSLFGQFGIIKVISEQRNCLHDIDNVIMETSKEENVHAQFGIALVKIMREENPEIWTPELVEKIRNACTKAYNSELAILNWIFDNRDLDYLKISDVANYMIYRYNNSLIDLGIEPVFEKADEKALEIFETFEVEQQATIHVDFFHKKNPNYDKFSRNMDISNLF
jgi:ribonucleoside-diphosphate reductase beta chain